MKKISDYELNKLLKKYNPKKIIYLHIERKINLTSKQIDKLLLLNR